MLREEQIERYARHILLREVGGVGQERILGARVQLRGLGRVGCWTATWLALAGVGELVLDDPRPPPARGLLPMLPPGGELRRDRALASQLAAFNPDVRFSGPEGGSEGAGELRERPAWAADVLLATIVSEGEGDVLLAAAAGEALVLGWAGDPCWRCVERALRDPGFAARDALAALAGSRAASAILGAILEPERQRRGLALGGAGGVDQELGACGHRKAGG